MCPACDGDEFQAMTVHGLRLRRCVNCGLQLGEFSDPPESSYTTIDPAAYLDSIGFVRRAQSKSIVAIVRGFLGAGDWLDVGCGYGYAVEAAQQAGYRARGIEPNDAAAQRARDRGIDVTHGILSAATPPADIVSTLDVLEHVADLHAFAELVREKTRALWVIKVPSSDGLFFRLAHALRLRSAIERLWQSRYEHPHLVYFNETALHTFLNRQGFDVVTTRYLQEIPTHTVVTRMTLDGTTPRWKAHLAVPAVAAINAIERLRSRSDALLVIARPRTAA
jgi:SAM-dependent methyltransferase